MKIVFLIQDITTQGGTERTTFCVAAELRRRGHDVSIVSVFRKEATPHYTANDVPVYYLTQETYTAEKSVLQRLIQVSRTIGKARRCHALIEADYVICQKILASTLAFLSGLGYKSIAAEHFTYSMYTPAVRKVRHALYKRLGAVVTLTEKDRNLYLQEHLKNVYCIPNMISVSPVPYQGEDSHRIVSVGRLTYQKGYDLLLQAVAKISDEMGNFYIDIYGEGEDRNQLELQCQQLGLTSKVHFRGYTDSIEQIYASSAFYVMSSRYEGFPMVLLEAAACGLPIVSFDCPEGPAILLKDGGGIVVENGNTEALGATILEMIQHAEKRQNYRRQLPQVIMPYSPQRIGDDWETLLVSFMKKQNTTNER